MHFLVLAMVLAGSALRAASLSMATYEAQVRDGNQAYRAAQAQNVALELAALEPGIAFAPHLVASVNLMDQMAASASPLDPQRIRNGAGDLAINKYFSSGTFLSAGYRANLSGIEYSPFLAGFASSLSGGNGLSVLADTFWSTGYFVTLQQPLIRGLGARGLKATQAQLTSQLGGYRELGRLGAASILFDARRAYVQLALTRKLIQIQNESLERNQKILDWAKRRAAEDLGDKVDVLQVEAALKMLELALVQAKQDEAQALARFNTLRGVAIHLNVDDLILDAAPDQLPVRQGNRPDLKAAELKKVGDQARIEEIKDKYLPDLNLFASYSVSGIKPDLGPAFEDSALHPSIMVGAKLDLNLDVPLFLKILKGAEKAAAASADDLEQKRRGLDQEWDDLDSAWKGLGQRRELATQLEALQFEKADREKKRYQAGRTTNFQVLRFEDDYAQARVQSLSLNAAALVLAAQADLFNGGGLTW